MIEQTNEEAGERTDGRTSVPATQRTNANSWTNKQRKNETQTDRRTSVRARQRTNERTDEEQRDGRIVKNKRMNEQAYEQDKEQTDRCTNRRIKERTRQNASCIEMLPH